MMLGLFGKLCFWLPAYRRWRKTWPMGMSKTARLFAYIDMLFVDHALLRIFFRNLYCIHPGVWRSSQPSPSQIRSLKKMGIRSIINLRGDNKFGSYALELEECKRQGIQLHSLRLYSQKMPSKEEVQVFLNVLQTVERPVLIHCKSGADRAGLASALVEVFDNDAGVAAASAQLSFRYLHIKHAKAGLLDYFFQCYANYLMENPELPDNKSTFLHWLRNIYNPDQLKDDFRVKPFFNWLVNVVLGRE